MTTTVIKAATTTRGGQNLPEMESESVMVATAAEAETEACRRKNLRIEKEEAVLAKIFKIRIAPTKIAVSQSKSAKINVRAAAKEPSLCMSAICPTVLIESS